MKLKNLLLRAGYGVFEGYIRLLKWTNRYVIAGEEILTEFREAGEPVILALWHESLLVPMCYLGNRDIHVLVSSHRTTLRYMHDVVRRFGWKMIKSGNGTRERGSQDAKALIMLIKAVKEGKDIVLTPDGTSGPVRKIKPGLLYVAQKTGRPIILFGVAASPCWRLKTWDKFLMPYPFSRGAIVFGQPNYLPPKMSEEEFAAKTLELEEQLNDLQKKAEEILK